MYAKLQREGLWDTFYMDAPARQRQCVEQYNIVKIAAAVCKQLLSKVEAKAEQVSVSRNDTAAKRIRTLISAVQKTHRKQNMHDRNLHKLVEAATAEKWAIIDEHNRRMIAII